ncbi:VirB2 family type IV secretion system major pilin TrwL [Bartonella saheliensis]|uniref:VirB2 family type IV secretion system major pilin TrwL n=1 Tax=Bartonella saheliensis TaxID=1457016 RepID=UPI00119E17DE|nr:VirB2 family type IV secretion system major pilin TrwL [Bartonella saheliensis]
MKKLNIFQKTFCNRIITTSASVIVFFMAHPVYAQAQDLTNAKTVLDKFKQQLDVIIPTAAAVILLCLAIGYAGRYIEKDTFVRWAIGVVIAGSALQIAKMLLNVNG